MSAPQVSVVIPTFNKQASLATVLTVLGDQHLPSERFEVVVVVDGSTDGTLPYLEALRPRYRLRHLRRENGGRSAARNFGAAEAQGRHVLFVDDDVLLDPAHLSGLVAALEDAPDSVHVGHLSNVRIDHVARLVDEISRTGTLDFAALPRLCVPSTLYEGIGVLFGGRPIAPATDVRPAVWWALITGGNLCVPRDAFLRVGGFDERFRDWGPEEADLGYRLFQAGVRATYNARCRLFHLDHDRDRSRLWFTLLQQAKQLYVKHGRRPELLQFLRYYNGLASLEEFNNRCADDYGLARLRIAPFYAAMSETTGRAWVVPYGTAGNLDAVGSAKASG